MARNPGLRTAIVAGAIVGLLGALGTAVGAQGPAGQRGQGPRAGAGLAGPNVPVWGVIARRLTLTPEQQQKFSQLVQNSNLPQLQREVVTARQTLASAIVNGGDTTGPALQLGTAEAQLTSQAAEVAAQAFRTILTDAQREQARQMWTQLRQNQQQRPQRRSGGV